MQTDNESRDLKYCRYYHGEQRDPYRDSFKGRAWMAELLAGERASDSAKDFLSFVAAHISKWEPYASDPDVARYRALKAIQMRVSILPRQLIWVFCSIATGESI